LQQNILPNTRGNSDR